MISCEGLGNGGVQAVMMGIVRNLSDEFLFDMLLFTSEKRFYDFHGMKEKIGLEREWIIMFVEGMCIGMY